VLSINDQKIIIKFPNYQDILSNFEASNQNVENFTLTLCVRSRLRSTIRDQQIGAAGYKNYLPLAFQFIAFSWDMYCWSTQKLGRRKRDPGLIRTNVDLRTRAGSDRDWWSPTFVLGRNLEKRKSTMTRSIRSASHKVDCSSFGKCAIL